MHLPVNTWTISRVYIQGIISISIDSAFPEVVSSNFDNSINFPILGACEPTFIDIPLYPGYTVGSGYMRVYTYIYICVYPGHVSRPLVKYAKRLETPACSYNVYIYTKSE